MDNIRNKIDSIDEMIMSLLVDRYIIVKEIGEHKKEYNIPVLDKSRENLIFERIDDSYLLDEHRIFLKSVYSNIMNEMKKTQNEITKYE